jgi:hypothetical protein
MQTLPTMGVAAKIIQKSTFSKKARYSIIAEYFSLKNLNRRRSFGQQARAVILGAGGGVDSFPIIGQQLDLRSRLCCSFTFTSGHFNFHLILFVFHTSSQAAQQERKKRSSKNLEMELS